MRGKRAKQIRKFADTFPGDTQSQSRLFKKMWNEATPAERKQLDKQMKDVERLKDKAKKEASDAVAKE